MAKAKTAAKKATPKKTASAKKITPKKAPAKKAAAKKPVAKKAPAKAKAKTPAKKTATARTAKTAALKPIPKRPSQSPALDSDTISALSGDFEYLRGAIEEFAAHMRALDRKRLNGIGIKRQGFTERAYMLAGDNAEFLPHWLTMEKFREDMDQFIGLRNLVDMTDQIRELLWNLLMVAADMAYTDALEFYSQIKDAAKRRVDAAESPFEELRKFFEHMGARGEDKPTEAEIEHDMHSLLKGRKDGKIVVENIRPKTTGGTRKVVDETFKDTASFKDTAEGSITE